MTSSSNGSTVTTNNKQLDAANGLAAWKALLNPQMLRQNDRQLDKVSRNYLQSLLRKWVAQAQLSPKLVTTLYSILLRLFEVWNQKAVTTDEKKPKENDQQQQEPLRVAPTNSLYSALYFECLPFKSLNDSRFLPAAQHGDPLSRFVSDRLLRSSLLEGFTGTIRLYGISSSIDQQTVANIVAAGIYTLWNMWLESFVMRDHQIVYPSPNTSQTKEYSKQEATISPPPTSTETTKNTVRDSLLRWLFGDATKRNHAKTPEDDHENAKPARKPSVSLNSSVKNAQAEVDNIPLDDTHRFRKLRIQLQDAQISSSPYVHFTTPRLLSRLQDEEDGFDTVKSVMQLNGGSKKTQSASFVARSKQNLQKRTSSIISLVKKQESSNERPALNNLIIPQHITAYSPLRSLGQICDKKIGLDHLYLETNNVDAFIKHQSIVLSLTSYPIGRPNRPCCGPTLCRISYFRFQSDPAEEHVTDADRPLGEMILQWCQQSGLMCKDQLQRKLECALRSGHSPESLKSSCSDTETASTHSTHRNANGGDHRHLGIHGCQQLIKDHVLCFSHNAGRINVFFASTDPVPQEENDKNESVKSSGIEIWQTCAECDQATHPVLMSKATYQFSFAKYLEFLLYNDKFATAPALNCHHANTKSNIIHQFRALDIPSAPIVKITYEEAPLYELRTPRLQVIPDAPKLKEHTPVSQSVLKRWKAQEEQVVNDFFQYVATHLDVMDNYVAAETKRETRSVTDQKRKGELQDRLSQFKEGLSLLRKSLLQDEKTQLQVELDKTPIDSLNDFRRLYSFRSSAILTRLREWQQKWCPDLMDECTWEPPDYMTDNKIHCFPGSSILVRQDEPSSIIAYTLSSNEYLTELKHALPVTPTDQTKAPSPPEVPTGKEKSDRVIDGYYSTTTRKYVAPSTGAASESASFRTMVMETVKANANELQYHQHRRLQGLRDRLSAHRHKNDNNLLNDNVTQRTMQTDVTEVKVTVQYPPKNSPKDKPLPPLDDNSNKNNNSKVQETIPNTNGTMENTPSPHIKHKYTHNGIEFTCIVYYAEEFEALRKQCGIDQLMVQSLSRCTAWNASGGKSKSRFYKSKDNRLVIKEMVNAWNNVEKESILKFTPKYLAHMRQSAGSPSLLVKIFGFYTIRIKSTHDKRTLLNLDVLVMEHLFYGTGPKLSMTFDLKGIRDRHVDEIRKQQKGDTTLWDGDWLDGYRLSFPVNEHSKALVEKCIRADADFLSKGNIMDYSLLVGVDDDKKELTVGIVDFIGAYTWYKKVESKSKSTLHPNKEVTVLPPEQYKWRFCRMIDDYFVAVPDKFDLVDEEHVWSSALI